MLETNLLIDSIADVIEWILAGLTAGLVIRVSNTTNNLALLGVLLVVVLLVVGFFNYVMKSHDLGT